MAFEAGEIVRIYRQAAAGGNDGFFARGEFSDDFFFHCAEGRLAVLRENITDGFARARLDHLIGIQKRKMELMGDDLSYGGFARSHEADERNVLNLSPGAHPIELADLARIGTQFFVAG